MKHLKQPLFYLFMLALAFSCSNSDDTLDPIVPQRSFDDVRQDFSEIDFTIGYNDIALLNHFNFVWNFRVIMPDVDFTNNNRPLIVTLHGYAADDPNAHKYTDCYAEPGFESLDAIIISPNADNLDWFVPYNVEQVLSLIDLAKEFLPVDPNKIVVNGYSDGGNGSWYLGETRSNYFSAAIPMASQYASYNPNNTPRVMPIPMYVIHGENDELFTLDFIQNWIDETNAAGSDITLEVAPGLTHPEPCEYVPYLQNAANWLENYVWN